MFKQTLQQRQRKRRRLARGKQGLKLALEDHFNLLLIDLQMPDIDGYSVLKQVRATLPANRCPRCIAMTANALREDRDKCLQAGFDAFLPKPFTSRDLKAHLLDTPPSTAETG